jgi:periplasmic divalent cation tolerance protein
MSANVILVLSSCADEAEAGRIAKELVEAGLAACVSQLPGISSTYRWQGSVQTSREVVLLIKTVAANFEALRARLQHLHSYELPEIIAVPVVQGSPAYLEWVQANCTVTAIK